MKVDYYSLVKEIKYHNSLPSWNDIEIADFVKKIPDLLKVCYVMADSLSHDPKTQIAALVLDSKGQIIGNGTNSLTFGMIDNNSKDIKQVRDSKECSTELKYTYMEHAERNAIFSVLRTQNRLKDGVMVCPYFSCVECSRAIIQSGIKVVVGHKQAVDLAPDRWKQSIATGRELFNKANVIYCEWDGKINSENLKIKMNGVDFYP